MKIIINALKRNWYIPAAGLACITGLEMLTIYNPQLIKRGIDSLAEGNASPQSLLRLALLMAALAFVVGVLRAFGRPMFLGFGRIIERDLRRGFYSHVASLPVAEAGDITAGEMMARSVYDLNNIRLAAGYGIQAGFASALTLVFAVSYMIYMSPFLTLLSLVPMVAIPWLMTKQSRKFHACHRNIQHSFSALTEESRDTFNAIRLVKVYNLFRIKTEFFGKLCGIHKDNNIELAKVSSLYTPVMTLVISVSQAVVWGLGGAMAVLGSITPGAIVAFSVYLAMLRSPLSYSGYLINLYQRSRSSVERMEQVFKREREGNHSRETESSGFTGAEADIEIKDLTYTYPGSTKPALKNLNFKITHGENVAIIGPVAGGKSTLFKLLTRIYEPPRGTIFIGGRDITCIPLGILRSYFGAAPQEPFVFSDSVRENLLMAYPEAGENELWDALDRAGLAAEVIKLPSGLDTELGEKGHKFSGGQKARLAFARLVLQNRGIFLLDDPLSAVDTRAEAKILGNLSALRRGRTNFIISHRPLSLSFCDMIFILQNGALEAGGTHKELYGINEIYTKLACAKELEDRAD